MAHIGLIAGTYQPQLCGVAHYTSHLRTELWRKQVSSIVLTTLEAAQQVDESAVQGVVRGWRVADILSLVGAIHRASVDVLHIQHAAGTYGFERAIFLLPLLLRLTGWRAPIVTTVHEYGWWEWQPAWFPAQILEPLKGWGQQRSWWDREDGFLLTQSDAVITSNRNAAEIIQSRLPNLGQKVYQIPIGANVQVVPIAREQARQSLRWHCGWSDDTDDTLVVAFFGFLHPVKGLETLLPAFKQLRERQPRSRLLLIGGVESLALQDREAASYWEKLQGAIATLNLTEFVHMTGYVDEAVASHYLSGADVGVLPFNHGVTLKSGSLLTLLAHSLPVIATRSDPPDRELLDDQLIRLISPRDVNQLAVEMDQLLADASLRNKLGQMGKHFSQKFAWSDIVDAHLAIYQTVLARPVTAVTGQAT